MSESRTPLKAALLLGPLVTAVLVLHAWGDAAADRLGERLDLWRYPEHVVGPYRLRAPRRLENLSWAIEVLNRFPDEVLRDQGSRLELRRPQAPVRVVLLDAESGSRRLVGEHADLLKEYENLYDP
ncbi:MAG: hypothetical protein JO332_17665, partial [Planctomycetaceae bacterium]|nr:hypothetical protein [Planctomycetaceae bacterium]